MDYRNTTLLDFSNFLIAMLHGAMQATHSDDSQKVQLTAAAAAPAGQAARRMSVGF